jgi:hypothetical protein
LVLQGGAACNCGRWQGWRRFRSARHRRIVRRPAVQQGWFYIASQASSIASRRWRAQASLIVTVDRARRGAAAEVERAVSNPVAAAGAGTSIAMQAQGAAPARPRTRASARASAVLGQARPAPSRRGRPETIRGERSASGKQQPDVPLDLPFIPGKHGEAANPGMSQLVGPVASLAIAISRATRRDSVIGVLWAGTGGGRHRASGMRKGVRSDCGE